MLQQGQESVIHLYLFICGTLIAWQKIPDFAINLYIFSELRSICFARGLILITVLPHILSALHSISFSSVDVWKLEVHNPFSVINHCLRQYIDLVEHGV